MHLPLLTLVFITVISCSGNQTEGLIKIESKSNTIILKKEDFKITENKKYFEVKILNNKKLDSVKSLVDCTIYFNKEKYVAKGINVKSSIKPVNCDYFFTEDDNKHIMIRDEVITLLSIDI